MTGAEFKTYREALGLSCQHIADLTMSSLRAVRYWEDGTSTVPSRAIELLKHIDDSLDRAVAKIAASVAEAIAQFGAPPKYITLLRYMNDVDLWLFHPGMKPLSTSTHGVLLSRAQKHFFGSNVTLRIQYMRPDEYRTWLNGRKDGEQERTEWASSLLNP